MRAHAVSAENDRARPLPVLLARPPGGDGPMNGEGRPGHPEAANQLAKANPTVADRVVSSQQVDWFSVHVYVAPVLEQAESWPLAGSPAWRDLADSDPRKLAAVLDGARRDALRNDTLGVALAEASHEISKSSDWSQISRLIRRRLGVYIPRVPRSVA
jgi:hypothetical protein